MQIKELSQTYVANTYSRFDLEAVKGVGALCIGADGKRYIDFTSGIGVNSLGFCDSQWVQAISEQAATLQHTSNLYYTEPMAKLAKMLCERTFAKRVFFANSGAEANEGLIKVARKYSHDKFGKGRHTIICLDNSFHGRTVTTLSATGQDVFHQNFYPFTDGFCFVPANDIGALKAAADDTVCAVMLELVQGEGGVVPLDKDYVEQIAAFCKEKELLLLIDEVQTGIGRTGKLLCCEYYDIQPDAVSIAKGIGAGLPLGAVLFGASCANTLGLGDHGTTFGGNPVACAGAQVVLRRIDEAFLQEVCEKGDYITSRVLEMPHVTGVDGKGLMLGISLEEGYDSKALAAKCLERGLMILTAKTKLRMLPPLTITKEEIKTGLNILCEVLKG